MTAPDSTAGYLIQGLGIPWLIRLTTSWVFFTILNFMGGVTSPSSKTHSVIS